MTITELTTPPPTNTKTVLLFWTQWHADSSPSGSTSKLFETLHSTTTRSTSVSTSSINFYRIEAEQNPSLSTLYNISIVPTFVFINENNDVIQKIEGMDDIENVSHVTNALQSLIQSKSPPPPSSSSSSSSAAATTTSTTKSYNDIVKTEEESPQEKLNAKLKTLIHSSTIMLFMKGTPTIPKCGFSRHAVELLTNSKLTFGSFDILSNEEVRQGLKVYSDWPTYPQLYVNGELIGGLDIMKEMNEESDGDLASAFGLSSDNSNTAEETITTVMTLDERLSKLINQSKVMLFMKGLPSQPRCGFSRQICTLLQNENITFDAFDILSDEEVRQGLKVYSDWPTYPQLYVDGELVGGLDIVKELVESGELKDMIQD